MTPAVNHPAAAHDAVAPVGVIRAAIVPTVVGRTEADRETRREAPAEPAPAQPPWPCQPPCQLPPCHLASAVPGRAAVAAPTAMTAAAAMAILRSDVRIAVPPHQQQPDRSMAGVKLVPSEPAPRPALSCRAGRCRGGTGPAVPSRPDGASMGVCISRPARAVFGGAGSGRDINRCDPPHSITV